MAALSTSSEARANTSRIDWLGTTATTSRFWYSARTRSAVTVTASGSVRPGR